MLKTSDVGVKMTASARRMAIERRLASEGEVDLAGLTAEFDVSEMTIRRDLEALEERGVLRRVKGGAIAFHAHPRDLGLRARAIEAAEKAHIAAAAASLLQPNESVFIDSGSTALAVAKAIVGRELALTVVTTNVLAALELANDDGSTVILTGGRLKPGELIMTGPEAEAAASLYRCDTFIMGAAGIDAELGFTEYQRDSGFIKRAVLPTAGRTIVVADASKLGNVELLRVAPLSSADLIVTDGPVDDPALRAAAAVGVQIITDSGRLRDGENGTDV